MLEPLEVRPLAGHSIWIRYSDGTGGEVDLSHLAGRGVFALWNDREAFERVHIGPGRAIAWSDEVELCPDAVYLRLTGKSPSDLPGDLEALPAGA
jgi:Protein of unknown function (DUF2442)